MKRSTINEVLLFCIVFTIGFQKLDLFGLKVVDYLILVSFALLLVRGQVFVVRGLYVGLLFLMLIALFGLVFSIDMSWSIGELVRYVLCFLLLVDLLSFYRSAQRRQIGVIILAGVAYFIFSLGVAVLVWMKKIPHTVIFTEWDFRLEAFFFDPNFMSIFALFLVALMNYEYSRLRTIWYVLGMATLVLAIFLSASRTSVALLAVVFMGSFLLFNRIRKKEFFLMAVLIGAAAIVLIRSQLLTVLVARFTYQPEDSLPDIRFWIWGNGLKAFFDNPFGYGPGTYRYVMERFGDFHDAHNTFLTWAVGDGIQYLGAVVIMTLYYFMFRKGPRRKRRFEILLLLLIVATSLTFDMDTFRATWLLFSIAVYKQAHAMEPGRLPETC